MENPTLNFVKNVVTYWWLLFLAGLLLVGIGVWMLLSPFQSLLSLCLAAAIGMMVSGCFEIVFSIKNHESIAGWGWLLTGGIVDLLIGGYLFNFTLITMVILPIAISIWILFRGIMVIGNALNMRRYGMPDWRWFTVVGINIIFLALLIMLYPFYGIKAILFWIGIAFILSGLFRIYISLKIRKIKDLISRQA